MPARDKIGAGAVIIAYTAIVVAVGLGLAPLAFAIVETSIEMAGHSYGGPRSVVVEILALIIILPISVGLAASVLLVVGSIYERISDEGA